MSKTISGLPLAETLTGDELLPVVQDGNTVQSTIQQVADLVGNTTTWGDIQGTLSNQTDLQNALNLKVPYTGATGNVNLGEYGISAGYFQADLTPSGASAVGRMVWNPDFRTTDLGLGGGNVVLHIGQKQVILVVNKTGATLTGSDYQVVKISGAQGQRPKVALAQANNDANSADTIGIVNETITNNQEGFVCTTGTITNINTTGSMQGETWADGDVLYLSGTTAGRLTNIKPQAPIHTVIVGFVIYAHNNQGKIYVKVDNGYELNELHNVRINGVTDGQVLAYDSTLSVWENINQSAITSGNSDKVDGYHVQVDGTGTDPNTIYFKTTGGVDPSAAVWGDITGSIVDQTDLYNALVNGTYATGNWNINASSVDGYSVQVDGTGTDPNTIYFKTTGGTISVDWDDVANTPTTVSGYGITDAVTTSGNQTIGGTKTFSSTITGSITGNADTVDGYNVQVDGTGTDPNTIYFKTTGGSISVDWDDVSNTPTTVSGYGITDAVTTSGNQTVGGTKTFSSTITGSITGNAGTVTNGVYTSGDQTIGGNKTFSSTIIGSIDGNSNTVDGYHVQVDGTGTDPNTIYFKTTGGSIGVDWDDISNTPTTVAGYGITDAVTTSGNQTIGGTKTFSSTITGSITGNAGTVTDGVYLSGTQTITGNKTFTGSVTMGQSGGGEGGEIFWLDPVQGTVVTDVPASGAFRVFQASGTARGAYIDLANCAGGVGSLLLHSTNYNSYAPTLTGTGASGTWGISVTGNAGTVTNGVYTTGNQTIGGVKTFSNDIGSTFGGQLVLTNSASGATNPNKHFRVGPTGNLEIINSAYNAVPFTFTDAGILSVSAECNAPVFKDVNNSAYYLDPANTGTSMVVAGDIVASNLKTSANTALSLGLYTGTAFNTGGSAISLRGSTAGYNNNGMEFYAGNSERMRLDSAGNLGVGTSSPASKLDVNGSANINGGLTIAGNLLAPSGATIYTATGDLYVRSGSSGALRFGSNGSNDRMLLNSSGNLGIGTTSPTYRLTVANNTFDGVWAESSGTYSFVGLGGYFSGSAGSAQIGYERSTGAFVFGNGTRDVPTERMRIASNGSVGIGRTPDSSFALDVGGRLRVINDVGGTYGGDFRLYNSASGATNPGKNFRISPTGTLELINNAYSNVRFQFTDIGEFVAENAITGASFYDINNSAYYLDPANTGTALNVAGSIVAAGNVTAYSDIRVKDNIEPIHNALDKLGQINGVTYTRTDLDDKERKYAGVIAQEIEQVLPEAVFDNGKVKAVDYNATIALLIEAVKEQQGQINELKLTIEQLKGN